MTESADRQPTLPSYETLQMRLRAIGEALGNEDLALLTKIAVENGFDDVVAYLRQLDLNKREEVSVLVRVPAWILFSDQELSEEDIITAALHSRKEK